MAHHNEILRLLKEGRLKLKLREFFFLQNRVEYFSHKVRKDFKNVT